MPKGGHSSSELFTHLHKKLEADRDNIQNKTLQEAVPGIC
jgi:hypothetical protein